jgi:hypothetical protein
MVWFGSVVGWFGSLVGYGILGRMNACAVITVTIAMLSRYFGSI